MIELPGPTPLFNPLTAPVDQPLTVWEILASPFGLVAFLPLAVLLRYAGRRWGHAAVLSLAAVWMVGTAGPLTTLVVALWCLLGVLWVRWLALRRASGALSRRAMVGLVWGGLGLLLLPFWYKAQWDFYGWQPSRLALLHNVGLAYFFLRLVAWGVDLARAPDARHDRLLTASWLAYPACMRLGPVMLRQDFAERFARWRGGAGWRWGELARRGGLLLLGGFLLAVVLKNTPHPPSGGPDFFAAPQAYETRYLVRLFYFVPIQVYLLLWTYNELAAVAGLLAGLEVDNNFDHLPLASSVRDFWRRWHVTVGKWLRDYIYVPLGGNRGLVPLHYAVVFGFCALWHGAAWSFVAWAASQVLALSVQRGWDGLRRKAGWQQRPRGLWWRVVCWLLTMHYQLATIVVFVDFEYCGWRFLRELLQRLAG